jgi:hypothetical protein
MEMNEEDRIPKNILNTKQIRKCPRGIKIQI